MNSKFEQKAIETAIKNQFKDLMGFKIDKIFSQEVPNCRLYKFKFKVDKIHAYYAISLEEDELLNAKYIAEKLRERQNHIIDYLQGKTEDEKIPENNLRSRKIYEYQWGWELDYRGALDSIVREQIVISKTPMELFKRLNNIKFKEEN